MRFHFTLREILDLSISALVLTVAFWNFWGGSVRLAEIILGVTTGFLVHELAHKFVGQKMRYHAHYVMWKLGTLIALVTSFFGVIFAAPGAVQLGPRIDLWGRSVVKKKQVGIIGLAGPATNIILALIFIAISAYYIPLPTAVFINLFLAGFNMIPFGPFDGYKVKEWSWWAWGATVAIIIGIAIASSKLI